MGSAVGADADSAVGSGNQDVEVAVADRGADLVEIACGGKGGVRAETGSFPSFASPAAAEVADCSAMPMLIQRDLRSGLFA